MSFRYEGTPKSAKSVSKDNTYLTANDGLLVSAPISTQSILIYDKEAIFRATKIND